jgi:hypothetical protein
VLAQQLVNTLAVHHRQAYVNTVDASPIGAIEEWLLPIGSPDPTYPVLSAVTHLSGLSYPDGAGDCLNPITQPSCYPVLPGYCGGACTYCRAGGISGPTFCARFKAPPVRSRDLTGESLSRS